MKKSVITVAFAFAFGFAGTVSAACSGGEAVCNGTIPITTANPITKNFSVGVDANGAFGDFAELQSVGVGDKIQSMIGSASNLDVQVVTNAAQSANPGCTGDCQNNWAGINTKYNYNSANVIQANSEKTGSTEPVGTAVQQKNYMDFSHHFDAGSAITK